MSYIPGNQLSSTQAAEAAKIRFDGRISKEDRAALGKMIHSADSDPHKHGYNPYADPTKTYDPVAQKDLDAIKARQKK
jgi:hypothetical protein